MSAKPDPFPTVAKLGRECHASWPSYKAAAKETARIEGILREVLPKRRLLDSDSSLVLCGSFARWEMVNGSDLDWTLLIDGIVKNEHAQTARTIHEALQKGEKKGLKSPGSSGTFGNMAFSHDLVHRIGGGADSNENLTRRILLLLESRPLSLSLDNSPDQVWTSVLKAILERYFEEDVHFSTSSPGKVPRFLLNDITRYWRTICVDYAAKHREQDGAKWAIRNAKIRFSRKLLYAAGLAFCFRCQLNPPQEQYPLLDPKLGGNGAGPFIAAAVDFAQTPPLEYLAIFIDQNVKKSKKRQKISNLIFGAYNEWLRILGDDKKRAALTNLSHEYADKDPTFATIRRKGEEFARGLKLLFFNREEDTDETANLSLEYVGF